MRALNALVLIALSVPLVALDVPDTISAASRIDPVEFSKLIDNPTQFMGSMLRFKCTFVQLGNLYDPLSTGFPPDRYLNMVVWDDRAKVWDPDVRAKPIGTLYASKDLDLAQRLPSLKKFQRLEVVGLVTGMSHDLPVIDVKEIDLIDNDGSFDDNSVYHVQQGVALSADNQHDLADGHFLQALDNDLPLYGRIEVQVLRAHELVDANRFKDASAVLTKALADARKDEEISDADLAQMHALLAKSDNESAETAAPAQRQQLLVAAVEHARKALDKDPGIADAYAVLGISLAGLGQFDEARRECDNALRLRPNDAEVRWYLGRILDQQGQHDDAIEALKKAIDITPKDARIHKAVAAAYYHRGLQGGANGAGDLATAMREYDIALRLSPGDPEVIYLSGLVIKAGAEAGVELPINGSKQAATRDLAIEKYKAALNADDGFAPAHHALAEVYRQEGMQDEALAQYQRVVELQPDDFDSVAALANYLQSQGHPADAIAAYQHYLATHPGDPSTLGALARLCQVSGDPKVGANYLSDLQSAHSHSPNDAPTSLALANYDLQSGFAADAAPLALSAWTNADLALKPAAAGAYGKALFQQGRIKDAILPLSAVLDQTSDEEVVDDLGWSYVATGKGNQVPAVANKLRTAAYTTDASAEFLGWVSYLSGDYPGAEQILAKAKFATPAARGYRLGMTEYKQGPTRYDEAKANLTAAKELPDIPLYANAQRDVSEALKAIDAVQKPSLDADNAKRQADDDAKAQEAAKAMAELKAAEAAKEAEDAKNAAPAPAPTATPAAAPAPADGGDPVAAAATAGKAQFDADNVKGAIDTLSPVASKLTDETALIDLGWSYVATDRINDASLIADQLKGLPNKTDAQLEFQGWNQYLNGDYRGAEQTLKHATIADPVVKNYRLGMVLFKQGPPRYPEARALLDQGKNVTGHPSLFANAKADCEAALKTINAQ